MKSDDRSATCQSDLARRGEFSNVFPSAGIRRGELFVDRATVDADAGLTSHVDDQTKYTAVECSILWRGIPDCARR